DQTPRLNRIQATSTRGVRARIRRVAGCATPTGSAGHASATANLKLTFHLDHSAGADQPTGSEWRRYSDQSTKVCNEGAARTAPDEITVGSFFRLPKRGHRILLPACACLPKWPAPGLDDTQLSKSGLPLELHRAQITDRRVSAFRVVEALDIVKHV